MLDFGPAIHSCAPQSTYLSSFSLTLLVKHNCLRLLKWIWICHVSRSTWRRCKNRYLRHWSTVSIPEPPYTSTQRQSPSPSFPPPSALLSLFHAFLDLISLSYIQIISSFLQTEIHPRGWGARWTQTQETWRWTK
jgi:hypothetical protein